jgi:CheY-like chemotaxis protein
MVVALPTILLVDDDEITRYLVRRCLAKLPLRGQVLELEADNGKQALALVQAHCQDCQDPSSLLVLLDLNMPVMDGLEFLEHHVRLPDVCRQVTAVVRGICFA